MRSVAQAKPGMADLLLLQKAKFDVKRFLDQSFGREESDMPEIGLYATPPG